MRTVQIKILNNETLSDRRGENIIHNLKLTDDVKELIISHCDSIPHRQSHYSHEYTSLKYFENLTLNLPIIYELFTEYYKAVTGILEPPIKDSTYAKFFNHFSGFTFTMPRTDVCNACKKKKEVLMEKNALCLEFDFAQNLPLPCE